MKLANIILLNLIAGLMVAVFAQAIHIKASKKYVFTYSEMEELVKASYELGRESIVIEAIE
jgi:hypothetical protein